ncbi:hypothetical protein C5E07_16635 [Pseudoclavibacter sp. RFBJ3]|uniref:hypothetical protein n=1 Tax=unclassified Pseudoclavibacter TaxID=2615177 RepID=UPI000CE82FA5|nr:MULTISPECIES: hypothetical protein [unclassified Pseudoclavibacter]PPF87563.1 hypothetical protein C5C12_00445 [Pseudoclavibacter sp. RFBJ5]PPF90413.1 hypothetical protein C5E07_16635 [Pseudoclavibacter sp. RFBJ3]PPG01098.1 hypothetical protein C5C19_00445 [Pseudoclavibacter sp. RFBH5]PPG26201.1 hypothetical protein C5E13_00400 [Pseudoclavibacter sp. RFBI4]
MTEQPPHLVTLDLTDEDRHAILINALQDYANAALDNVERAESTTAERDHFQIVARTAHDLVNEIMAAGGHAAPVAAPDLSAT